MDRKMTGVRSRRARVVAARRLSCGLTRAQCVETCTEIDAGREAGGCFDVRTPDRGGAPEIHRVSTRHDKQKVLCICRHHVRRLAEVLSQTLGDLSDIAYLAIRCVGQAFSAKPIELSKVNRLVT